MQVIKPAKDMIIAIDGYSSCGKSTLARDLANILNYTYIDSGAMYRAVTWLALQHGLVNDQSVDIAQLGNIIMNLSISFQTKDLKNEQDILINGEAPGEKLRSTEVSANVSYISKIGLVRKKMVEMQRMMGRNKRVVMDGRDIGTVVFPDADIKIFMTASLKIRTQRRFMELKTKNIDISFEEVKDNLKTRDLIDESREESPLRKADGAMVLDNSFMSRTEQLEWIVSKINEQQFS
ncbi:MAG: (d)CMP kinase [Bacteroidia bacterium]|nr:(d)CMP kinase [Bacteroidia bacterium]